MKYLKQTDTYSCGPVALINATIFQRLGSKYSLDELRIVVNCKYPNGTMVRDFWNGAVEYGYTRVYEPTLDKLHEILDRGDAVILNHGDNKRRHYSLIIDRTNVSYGIVNHYHGPTLNPVHKSTFIKDVWRTPKLWLVKNLQQKTQNGSPDQP